MKPIVAPTNIFQWNFKTKNWKFFLKLNTNLISIILSRIFPLWMFNSNHGDIFRFLFYLYIQAIFEGSLFEPKKLVFKIRHTYIHWIKKICTWKLWQSIIYKCKRTNTRIYKSLDGGKKNWQFCIPGTQLSFYTQRLLALKWFRRQLCKNYIKL